MCPRLLKGSSIYTGNTNVNVSNYNSVTLEAQWQLNRLYLYNEGNEYTSVTGGWTDNVLYAKSQCQTYGVYCNIKKCYKNTNNINCNLGSVGVRTSNYIITTNSFNLSQYTKIVIVVDNFSESVAANDIFITASDGTTVYNENVEYQRFSFTQNGTSSFDLSLTNNTTYYVAIGNGTGSQPGSANFKMYKLWLE